MKRTPLEPSIALDAELLYEAGYGYKKVARTLGISTTTVRRLVKPGYRERLNTVSREAKRRRKGRCADCGRETSYNGRPGRPTISELCNPCAAKRSGAKRFGQGPNQLRALDFLAHPRTPTELTEHLGASYGSVSVLINTLLKRGLIRRVRRGLYVRA